MPTRLLRVSFTGELGFEVNVPADFGRAVWEAICGGGPAARHDALRHRRRMHVLRAEKGYIIVGQETDGTVTPDDAGLGWAIGKTKPDFVGKRSLAARLDAERRARKQLVGLRDTRSEDSCSRRARRSSPTAGQTPPMRLLGHVTSSYYSADARAIRSRWRWLRAAARASARRLYVPMPDGDIAVKIVDPRLLRS